MKYIGCDFHPSFQQIAMLDTGTGETLDLKLKHDGDETRQFYESLKSQEVIVGIEASGNTYWFERLLSQLGHQLWMGDAAAIRRQDGRKQKHDRRDARLILKLMLSKDGFPKIWVPTVAERDLRQLLIHRRHLVRTRVRIKNQLQHIALNYGLQRKGKLWSREGMEFLRSLELEPWTRLRRDRLLEQLAQCDADLKPLEIAVQKAAEENARAVRLQTHPGVWSGDLAGDGADHGRGVSV
jgi:transposase